MAYKLYTDRQETFSCEVDVRNASLKKAFSRIIVESNDLNLVFPGEINNGTCTVPIKKLKGILEEGDKGKIKLEIIVEDVYFKPWEEDFIVEEHTSVKVKVQEHKNPEKPSITIKVPRAIQENISTPVKELLYICERMGISKKTLRNKKDDFKEIVKEYFKDSPEFSNDQDTVIKETITRLK